MSFPNSTTLQGAVTPVDSVQGTSMASTGPSEPSSTVSAPPRPRNKRYKQPQPRRKADWTEEEWDEYNARVALQLANEEVWHKNRKEEKKREAQEKREAEKEAERRREVLHKRRQRFQQAQMQGWNSQPQFQHTGMLQQTSQWNSYWSLLQQPSMMGTMQYQPALQSHQTTTPGGHYPTALFPGQMQQAFGATQVPTANQDYGTNMGMPMHPNHQATSLNTGMGMPHFPMPQQQHAFLSAPFSQGHQALPQQQQQQQQQPDLGNWHSNIPARQAAQPAPRPSRPQPCVHKPEPRWRPIAASPLPTRAPTLAAPVRSNERTRHDPIPLPSHPAPTPGPPTTIAVPAVSVSARPAALPQVNNLDWLAAEAAQYAPAQAQRFSGLAAPAAGVARSAVRGQARRSGERIFALAVPAPAAMPAPTAMMMPAPAPIPAPASVPAAIPAMAPAMAAPMGLGMAAPVNPFLPSAPDAELPCAPDLDNSGKLAANYDWMASIPAPWDDNLDMTRELFGGEPPVQMGGEETPAPWADATEAPI